MSSTSVLEEIKESVIDDLNIRKKIISARQLEKQYAESTFANGDKRSLRASLLREGIRVIAEVKYQSPSQGFLPPGKALSPVAIADQYVTAGAAALSVLTEQKFFGGSLHNLKAIREAQPNTPLLMKDFVLDPYQLLEARAYGADAVLLMVSLLGPTLCKDLFNSAKELGLECLVEVHNSTELNIAKELKAPLIGINNRDLKTLEISLEVSEKLIQESSSSAVTVAESGLDNAHDVMKLKKLGFKGFLIGSALMKAPNPGLALGTLLEKCRSFGAL